MTTQHFADTSGRYIGGFSDGALPPRGSVETPAPPTAWHLWNGSEWAVNPSALATEARAQRNTLLAASDWTQVADAPVNQAAWATYRQELRDITDQAGFPEDINWPAEP